MGVKFVDRAGQGCGQKPPTSEEDNGD